MKRWHDRRYPESPWFFPSADDPENNHVDSNALCHTLRRLAQLEPAVREGRIIPKGQRRTSHGLRAFYVTVRRSEGIEDGSIAAELGDKTGPSIIESTYGGLPPNWLDTSVGKISFLPEQGEPAWVALEKGAEKQQDTGGP